MSKLVPTSHIRLDEQRCQLFFTIAGYWDSEDMKAFLVALGRAAGPLIKAGKPFGALGDLSDFVPQDRATAEAIRDSLLLASRNGLKRFAIVAPPALVKLQYRRITAGLDVEFFGDRQAASAWLAETCTPAA